MRKGTGLGPSPRGHNCLGNLEGMVVSVQVPMHLQSTANRRP